jgi:hypothetical protein
MLIGRPHQSGLFVPERKLAASRRVSVRDRFLPSVVVVRGSMLDSTRERGTQRACWVVVWLLQACLAPGFDGRLNCS